MPTRNDRLTELLVDDAINIATVYGVAAGARALVELEVPFELAHRVLLQPGRRRRADYLEFIARQASNRSTTRP